MNRCTFKIFLIALVLGCLPQVLQGAEYLQKTNTGVVDWYVGRIAAESVVQAQEPRGQEKWRKQLKIRRAGIEARKKLWETLAAVRIDQGLRVKEILARDPDLADTMRGKIHNAWLQIQQSKEDKTLVRAEMSLRGEVSRSLIPRSVWFEKEFTTFSPRESDSQAALPYTGLIIDAQTVEFAPALIIRVADQQGRTIYSPLLVDPDFALSNGICQYVTDLQSAVAGSRAGVNPFLVRATGVDREGRNSLRISETTAKEFMALADLDLIYQECRVVIVLKSHFQSGGRANPGRADLVDLSDL